MTHAVLIGIETYQKQDICPVQYALADAAAVKEVLVQHFGVAPENISLWLDSDATRSAFENDLPYMIRGLSPGDRFIFFYAGHGFYANGTNRLTTWDTHPNNLVGTTVSLEEVLLKPLKERQDVDNQWTGDVFTLHHLGGDAAVQLKIAPIRFEGFNQVSLHFEAVPFIGPTNPDAKVHFHFVTNDDGVPRHVDKPSFVMLSFVKDAQHLNKPEVSYLVAIRYKWGAKTEEEHFQITWNNNRRRMTIAPSDTAHLQKEQKHNIAFLNAEVVKLMYSGPGYSDRTDGKHSFSEVVGPSTGTMIGLVARFRNDAVYGEDVAPVNGVRAHLKLFDHSGKEIGTGFSSAQWLAHPDETFDLLPNGRGGSVLVFLGGKDSKPRVQWKSPDASGRMRDRDLELHDGYPSRVEITLMDSNHKPLMKPVVLEIMETGAGVSVSVQSDSTEPSS